MSKDVIRLKGTPSTSDPISRHRLGRRLTRRRRCPSRRLGLSRRRRHRLPCRHLVRRLTCRRLARRLARRLVELEIEIEPDLVEVDAELRQQALGHAVEQHAGHVRVSGQLCCQLLEDRLGKGKVWA